ncbi:MAG: aspartate kinase [Clostridia bacterium]|nr:aspartate kinase [Clostridia bacterium]
MIVVQKYGGSSVADNDRLRHVAEKIKRTYDEGFDVVVAVSAQGKTTDFLIDKARSISENIVKRELDVLLSTGEIQSMALLSMMLHSLGVPAISLNGIQAGISASGEYGDARISEIDTKRILEELGKRQVVIVAGFQAKNEQDDFITLGRGGSDTTAVALAAALSAGRCEIYSDVDGVFTADPRVVKNAKKLDKISYDDMIDLACMGAKVLNNRAVSLAKKYRIRLRAKSSFEEKSGTEICATGLEDSVITSVTADRNVKMVTVSGVEDIGAFLDSLKERNVSIDNLFYDKHKMRLSFTVKAVWAERLLNVESMRNVSKVSVVGVGLYGRTEILSKIFSVLLVHRIDVSMVDCSDTRISIAVAAEDTDVTLNLLHDAFIA